MRSKLKLILFPILVVILLGSILIYIAYNGQPKATASYEQVWQAVQNQGYTPIDATDDFKNGWNNSYSNSLQKAIFFESGKTKLHFFIFDTDKSAHGMRIAYWQNLRYESGRYGTKGTNLEYKSSMSNYTVYWVKTERYYTVLTRVGNTLLYAEADADANKSICDVIEEIGYN